MKTRVSISVMAIVAIIATSCSSTKNLSYSPSWSNDIYGTSPQIDKVEIANKNDAQISTSTSNSDLERLEKAYAYIEENDISNVTNDTVIYKADYTNPYDRILSDSYEESYERRLRGFESIRTNSASFYDDLWIAQAYDPSFYNIIIMGDQVWVEPRYITASFGWPRHYFSFNWGCGYTNYNPYWSWNWNWGWGYSNYYSHYYYHSPWNYYSYWNYPYYGWYDHHHGNHHHNNNNNYGRNSMTPTINSTVNTRSAATSNTNSTRIATARSINNQTSTSTATTRAKVGSQLNDNTNSQNPTTTSRTRLSATNTQNPPTTKTRTRTESSRINVTEPTRGSSTHTTPRVGTQNQSSNNNNTSRANNSTNATTRGTYNKPGKVFSGSSSSSNNSSTQRSSNSGNYNNNRSSSNHSSGNSSRSSYNSGSSSRSSSSSSSSRSTSTTSSSRSTSTRR